MKYINISIYDKTKTIDSPTYGKYIMRKVAEVDQITALKDKKFVEVMNAESKILDAFNSYTTVNVKCIERMGEEICLYELYIAFEEDNTDWKDPKNYLEELPIAVSVSEFKKIIRSLFPG